MKGGISEDDVFQGRKQEGEPSLSKQESRRTQQEERADNGRKERPPSPERTAQPAKPARVKSSNPLWVRQEEGYDHMFMVRDTKANMKRQNKSDQCRETAQRAGDCPCPDTNFRHLVREVYARGETVAEGCRQPPDQQEEWAPPQARSYLDQRQGTDRPCESKNYPEPRPGPQPRSYPEAKSCPEPRSYPEPRPCADPRFYPESRPCPDPRSYLEPRPSPQPRTYNEPRSCPEPRPGPERMPYCEPGPRPDGRFYPDPRAYQEPQRSRPPNGYPYHPDMPWPDRRDPQFLETELPGYMRQWPQIPVQCVVCKKTVHRGGHKRRTSDEPIPNPTHSSEISQMERSSKGKGKKKSINKEDKATQTKRKRRCCC